MGRNDSPRAALIQAVAIGIGYAVLAVAAIRLTRLSGGIALLWLANAPLIAALAVSAWRRWPLLVGAGVCGSILASVVVSPFAWISPVFATANIGEAALAAVLLRRWGVARTTLDSASSIGLFVAGAAVIAPLAGGVFLAGCVSIALPFEFSSTLFDWQLGHGIGNLIGVPFALMWTRSDVDWRRFNERHGGWVALGCTLVLAGTTAFVFGQSKLPLLFLPIAPLLLGTFQLQRFGAAGGVLIIALIGGVMTVNGHGPLMLMHMDEAARLQFFQFYLAVLFVTALPVSAALWQRDKLSLALAANEARYRLLADNATDIMLTLDPDGTIRFASPAVRELGHFDPDELIGRNAASLVHEDDRERVTAVHREALDAPERTFSVEYRAVKADGTTGWFETNTRAVRNASGTVGAVVSVIRDLGDRKEREAELERAASTDPLTGLLNRASFRARIDEALGRTGQPATLALLDLDHFKSVNDRFGHATGDTALLLLADLLRDNLRAEDSVGRVGGEEFAILFAGLPLAASVTICDRLRAVLTATPVLCPDGGETYLTMSIGLTPLRPGYRVDALFAEADVALYAAKANGRDRTEVAAT
jgi:diguanylate cyclase (GGDEF)-like protein/PAS domain S-box-containing protein